MKARILAASLMLALVAGEAQAQKPAAFGIGITIGPGNLSPGGEGAIPQTDILFPMNFGAFRLEPIFGVTRASYKESEPFVGDIEESIMLITLGVGAFMTSSSDNGFVLYGGPRLGMMRSSATEESGGEEFKMTSTDLFIGAAVGGEHMFSSRFSLGAEARLTHFIAGEPDFDPDIDGGDFSAAATITTGVLTARFYF